MLRFKEFLAEGATWSEVKAELTKHKVYKNGSLSSPATDGTNGVFYYQVDTGLFGRVLNSDDKGFHYFVNGERYYLTHAVSQIKTGNLFVFKTRNDNKAAEKYIKEVLGFAKYTANNTKVLENSIKE